jgi:hypothetical protein
VWSLQGEKTAKFLVALFHTEKTAAEVPGESIKPEKKNKNGRKRQRQEVD